MERLSDTAIEIINELHTERLDYSSEYIPLIDAANSLAAYEDTGLEPEEIKGFAEDVAYQFGYYFPIKDILYISTGGFPHWSGHSGFSDGTTHILFQSVNANFLVVTNTQLAGHRQRMAIKEYAESILQNCTVMRRRLQWRRKAVRADSAQERDIREEYNNEP